MSLLAELLDPATRTCVLEKFSTFSNSHYGERLETLSANFVGHFVEDAKFSKQLDKVPDKVGDEDMQTAVMRTAELAHPQQLLANQDFTASMPRSTPFI